MHRDPSEARATSPRADTAASTRPRRRVLLAVPTLSENDAVGHDTLALCRSLREAGWDAAIHCGTSGIGPSELLASDPDPWRRDQDAVLVYVGAAAWGLGEALVTRWRGPRVLRFHGGPPSGVLSGADPRYRRAIRRYWAEVRRLLPLFDLVLTGSEHARARVVAMGVPPERVSCCGLMLRLRSLHEAEPDASFSARLTADPRPLVLTVARIVVQKGHLDVVRVASRYLQLHPRGARFLLAGKREPDGYVERVEEEIERLGLQGDVELAGLLEPGRLRTAFESARVLLSLSRSESFCVPVLEAQSFDLPVIARASMAVPEVVGDGGVLVEGEDLDAVAAELHRVLDDEAVRSRLIAAGRANLRRFSDERTALAIRTALDTLARSGARSDAPVRQRLYRRLLEARSLLVMLGVRTKAALARSS